MTPAPEFARLDIIPTDLIRINLQTAIQHGRLINAFPFFPGVTIESQMLRRSALVIPIPGKPAKSVPDRICLLIHATISLLPGIASGQIQFRP